MRYVDKIVFRGNETYKRFYRGNDFLFALKSELKKEYLWVENVSDTDGTFQFMQDEREYDGMSAAIKYSKDGNTWAYLNKIIPFLKGETIYLEIYGDTSHYTSSDTEYEQQKFNHLYSDVDFKLGGVLKSVNDGMSFDGLFYYNPYLVELDEFRVEKGGLSMNYFFKYCSELRKVRIESPNVGILGKTRIFEGCSNLSEIYLHINEDYNWTDYIDWVDGVAQSGTLVNLNERISDNWQFGSYGIPWGWEYVNINALADSDILSFTALDYKSSVTLRNYGNNQPDVKYSLNGTSWSTLNNGTIIPLDQYETILIKGNNGTQFSKSADDYSTLSVTGNVIAHGKITSLLDDCTNTATELGDYCFRNLFNGSTGLITAPELPDIVLGEYCYHNLFYGCTSLVNVQESLTTSKGLKKACYFGMFHNCTSLTKAPVLGNTTLAEQCYTNLFYNCTGLVDAPALPATTLAINCYQNMFKNCTSLVNAPATLPAATLKDRCYIQMFYGCTSLKTAPKLPATRLVTGCYTDMFNGCSSLNYINASFTTNPSSTYTGNWVNGVAASGTYVKNKNATYTTRSANAIPVGWTVQTA